MTAEAGDRPGATAGAEPAARPAPLPVPLLLVLLALAAFGAWAVGLAVTVSRQRSDLEAVVEALTRLEEFRAEASGSSDPDRLREAGRRLLAGPPFEEFPLDGRGMEEAASRAADLRAELGRPGAGTLEALRRTGDLVAALRRRAAFLSGRLGDSWSHLNLLVAASLLLAALAGVTLVAVRAGRRRAERFAGELRGALERLQESRREAEEANAAKSRFLANVSHELRTPIQGILGAAELLQTARLPAEARDHLDIVRRSSEHLLDLVNDLLDLSRIEAGRLRILREPVDPAAVVEEVGALVAGLPRSPGVALSTRARPGVPARVWSDGGRLRQVLANLAGNAVKFTEKGRVDIEVQALPGEGGRTPLRFSVSDTGIGIPPEEIGRLFRPFAQVENSTARRYGGTGLGLAISREIVEALGGRLEVDSAPGRGSVFHFTLALEEAPAPAPRTAAPAGAEGAALPARRVLVVDDEGVNRVVLPAMLRRLGWEARAAASGEEALAILEGGGFDAVLLDVQMPGLDGHGTVRRLREREAAAGAPRLPVLAVTASAMDEDRRRALESGMDGYLAKPVRLADLEEALASLPGLRGA
ncbi:MAG: ATP-binding protein [Planctomycetes bacterium]|nr:ATP-binding protein [Planctomycetota bacterium]